MEEPVWHILSPDEAVASLDSDAAKGLGAAEARNRLARYGENRLAESRPRPVWLKFLDQFKSYLVIVLVFAAVVAWVIGDFKDAAVILVVVIINAGIGFYQEHRAERTLAALKAMLGNRARVRRDGRARDMEASQLVPGDVVLLEAGDRVPADGRLLTAHSLEVDEATLTGESLAVGKSTPTLRQADLSPADRTNMLFMNTVVTRGRAELLITATGMQTETGKLAGMIAQVPERQTPLQRQLDALGRRLAIIAGVVVLGIFALIVARGAAWFEAALTAVALAVAAIPEGLPAVVTVTLAIGMWRMARHHAILKRLAAVETLGSTTVICTDKTGTLTLNQMTARAVWYAGRRLSVSGEGYEARGRIEGDEQTDLRPLLLPMALCTESRVRDGELVGDPTEGALYVLAQKGGLDPSEEQERRPRIAEIPFDSSHKFMATFHHVGERVEMYIKGAPSALLANAANWQGTNGPEPIDDNMRAVFDDMNTELANEAMRVLAVATRSIPAREFDAADDLWRWTESWTFLGLAGLMDPPRPEAADAIARCKQAGVQVKMMTGDHRITAAAVARELGLGGEVVSGDDLAAMGEDELTRRIDAIGVFARLVPQQKVAIVRALKADGHVVAMTGDGVNDAPALKAADIGVAMGVAGTAVTKEAATLVLTDDNFATIVRAVEEGRIIYDNIVKFVRFQLSTNVGAVLTVLTAALSALPTPFTAIQLLWINIIMDGPPAMTLGVEPARPGLMDAPPRRSDAQILSVRRLLRLVMYGATMAAGTLALFVYGLARGGETYAVTLAFTAFVLYQVFNVFNARAEYTSAFNENFMRNGKLWLALLGVVLLQVAVVYWPPAQRIFGTSALAADDWMLAVLAAATVLILDEIRKLLWRLFARARPPA